MSIVTDCHLELLNLHYRFLYGMKYPVGIQSFEALRDGGFVYVDKTDIIYNMVSQKGTYFLSRPRRFGKSLVVSTLEAYFQGRKDLFEGLRISQLETEWTVYPIIHIDLSGTVYDNTDSVEKKFESLINQQRQLYGLERHSNSIGDQFGDVIRDIAQKEKRQVVILIDEYDKPLLASIGNKELFEAYRLLLRSIYSNLKSQDKYIRLSFITGVSRFSHVSIFSDLNNVIDMTLDKKYSSLCGITDEEIDNIFRDSVAALAESENMTYDWTRNELRRRYDGYHFANNSVGVYNPFSLLSSFYAGQIANYWASTGTPDLLVRLIKEQQVDITELNADIIAGADELAALGTNEINAVSVLFQSGYLTIKGYDRDSMTYRLGFPNDEVRNSFSRFLLPYYTNVNRVELPRLTVQLVNAIKDGKPDDFLKTEQALLAGIPKDVNEPRRLEQAYRDLLVLTFRILGFTVTPESALSGGRSDAVVETPKFVYIFEFKLDGNGSADDALKQIEDKHYADRFATDSRRVFKIGVAFDNRIKNISGWEVGA